MGMSWQIKESTALCSWLEGSAAGRKESRVELRVGPRAPSVLHFENSHIYVTPKKRID